jgi:hypothetical protein
MTEPPAKAGQGNPIEGSVQVRRFGSFREGHGSRRGARRWPGMRTTCRTPTKGVIMRLGTSIVLIAIGAILTFALNVSVSGVDLDVVGWILMIVGALGIVLELAIWGPRTRRRVTHSEGYAAPADAPVRRSTTEETY